MHNLGNWFDMVIVALSIFNLKILCSIFTMLNPIDGHKSTMDYGSGNDLVLSLSGNRVGVNSIPELELQLNSNSNSGIGIGIGIEISGIENGIGIEIPGIGIGIGIENRNWIFCNCYRSTY